MSTAPGHAARRSGFALIEITVAIAAFCMILAAGGRTVISAVQMTRKAVVATQASSKSRDILNKVEGLLSAASKSSLETLIFPGFMTEPMRTSVTSMGMGSPLLVGGALPLGEVETAVVFFHTIEVVEGQPVPTPAGSYLSIYAAPTSEPGCYDLVYYDGGKREILQRNLAKFRICLRDGLVHVTLTVIEGQNEDGTPKTSIHERDIICRLP